METSPPQSAEDRAIRPPRRPFLVALALAALIGAFELTPELPAAGAVRLAPLPSRAAPRPASLEGPVDSAELERVVVARFQHRPLARALRWHTRDGEVAERVARAIVKEAGHLRVEPSLLAGMLLVENARLEPRRVSHRGAIGLMQVMRFHAGEYDCDSDDLLQVESNICHGARVFGHYLKRTGDVHRALLRYNGCVAGSSTRSCRRYPAKVLRAASTVRHEVLRFPAYRLGLDSVP